MSALAQRTVNATVALVLLCSLRRGRLLADGDGKSEAAKARPPKIDAPAPLPNANDCCWIAWNSWSSASQNSRSRTTRHYQASAQQGNVRGRLMTQFGLYSQTTPRNDASPARGQWQLDNAYRYISEAYGGYPFNALHWSNVDGGIFLSYIRLFY